RKKTFESVSLEYKPLKIVPKQKVLPKIPTCKTFAELVSLVMVTKTLSKIATRGPLGENRELTDKKPINTGHEDNIEKRLSEIRPTTENRQDILSRILSKNLEKGSQNSIPKKSIEKTENSRSKNFDRINLPLFKSHFYYDQAKDIKAIRKNSVKSSSQFPKHYKKQPKSGKTKIRSI
ncbi:hypothetical protein HK096_000336, partial [Nowakowskiella sp. JEL0078]